MKAGELKKICDRLCSEGKGDYPVYLFEVDAGVPYATELSVDEAPEHDGKMVRVMVVADARSFAPEWLGGTVERKFSPFTGEPQDK